MRENGQLAIALPAELVEEIAQRAAEIMVERHGQSQDGYLDAQGAEEAMSRQARSVAQRVMG